MENIETPAVFGKRVTPPATLRYAFDTEGELVELKRSDLPKYLLLLHNRGSKGPVSLGFTGEFREGGRLVHIYEVGKSAYEVYIKLSNRVGLEKFREAILGLAKNCA